MSDLLDCVLVITANLLAYPLMNVLIEEADKLEYLTSDGRWTKNVALGKSFTTTEIAFQTAKKEPIGRFNIVSYIPQTRQFINMNHGRGKGSEIKPGLENAPESHS